MRDRKIGKITRGDLLGGAAAVAAFTVVPRQVLGGAGNTAPSEKVNVAIIGTGGQGIVNMKQLFIGTKGSILGEGWGRSPRIIPEAKMRAYKRPAKTLPRVAGHSRNSS